MWSKWEDLYEIIEERTEATDKVPANVRYFVIDKATREKHFTKSRPYGYSDRVSAKCGAAHRFRQVIKVFEKEFLK